MVNEYFRIAHALQPVTMSKIRKEYITNPDFDPAKVANASSAAEGLCKWVLAMEIYDRVAKIVAPKKERMQLAEADLSKTLDHLSKKRSELKTIEERLLNLKQQFQDMTEKKEKLELQVRRSGELIFDLITVSNGVEFISGSVCRLHAVQNSHFLQFF